MKEKHKTPKKLQWSCLITAIISGIINLVIYNHYNSISAEVPQQAGIVIAISIVSITIFLSILCSTEEGDLEE